jgi:hypothetical protein
LCAVLHGSLMGLMGLLELIILHHAAHFEFWGSVQ